MHKLEKLILESYISVLQEKERGTIKLKDLSPKIRQALEDRYGKSIDPDRDFLDKEMETYYFTNKIDKETGSVGHKVINLPSFKELYFGYSDIIDDIKVLMGNREVQTDPQARELFELIKTNFRKIQSYLRNNRPDQYAMMKATRALEEAVEELKTNYNDPVLVKARAAKMRADKLKKADSKVVNVNRKSVDNSKKLDFLKKERDQLMRDMEQEAEPEGGPIADMYGEKLNRIDNAIAKLSGRQSLTYHQAIAENVIIEEEEAGPETVLEDATDQMLEKFPTLKAALIKLQTEDFKEFVDKIDWISPRPTEFRINLTNGQDYILKWTGKGFEAQIMGKRYFIDKINDYQQALDKLAILYKEGPMGEPEEPVEPADTDTGGGSGGDFPGDDAAGGDDAAADDAGLEGGEEEGGEDLTDEPVDFEEPAEDPEA